MNGLAYVLPSLFRNPRRTGAYLAGTVIAIALLASVLFFVVGAAQVLTQRSIAGVRPDMQAVASSPSTDSTALQRELAGQPGVSAAERFAIADFGGTQVRSGSHIGQTGSGRLIAVDPSYLSVFHAPVIRQGAFRPNGVVISQDLGTNLGARVGGTIAVSFGHGVPLQRLRVTGVASMLNTDLLFAPIDPVQRATPFNPPANVMIMSYGQFERTLKPILLRHAPPTPVGSVIVRSQAPVTEQIHLRIDRRQIPADPAQAKIYTTNLRHRMELALAGRATVLDNVGDALNTAQSDVLWAQIIFVFLALPGVVLAAGLARYITATVIDAQRRELALLRLRGAGPRQLLSILGMMLLLVALVGVVLGLGAGWVTAYLVGSAGTISSGPLLLRTILIGLLAGLLLGAIATFWPLAGIIRSPIIQARRRVTRGGSPLWARLYLDVIALAGAIAIYLLTQRNGFQPVLNAEGNPTISLSFFTFLAPLLFWLGAILLLVRLSRGLVSRSGSLLIRGTARRTSVVAELASRTLARRSGALHQAVVLVAMAVAFSSGLAVFVHTYAQQQRVDAELTLGSDVKVTVVDPARSSGVSPRLHVPGVAAVTPFRTTVAYVGTEIQDMFGIDVPTFLRATRPTDSFFIGGTAGETLHRLQTTPNGILVSAETARDYSLNLGDTLLLRLVNHHTGRYVPVHFRLVGVVREFATAPKDAFLVANLAYIQKATQNRSVDTFLIKTNGSPTGVTAALQRQFATGPAVHVQNLNSVQQQLATSLTSLDLTGLSRIDYLYTLAMVLAGLLVFTLAVLLERNRDFAMLEVLGAGPRQISALLLIEIGYAVVAGAVLGLIVGLGFAQMLIQILTSIFDPPPSALAVPWSSLGLILGIAVLSGVIAWGFATVRLRQNNLAGVLREG